MKRLFLLAVLATSLCLTAQDDAAMQAMMKHAMPGSVHQQMAETVGSWKVKTSMWMSPETPPQVSEGTCENTMIMDGKFQRSVYKGVMMGMPFQGEGLTGWDNTKKQLQSTWVDNFGTSLTYMTGTVDDKGTQTLTGKMLDPMTGSDMDVRMVTRAEGKDRYVMEMYMVVGGQEVKMMEIDHTR